MTSRRRFLCDTTASLLAVTTVEANAANSGTYDEAVRATWRHHAPGSADKAALRRELVRYATLAPSSHNTQCWKFRLEADAIAIVPDLTRRCPVVDPDDHHLYASLGCAAENLVHAAAAHGWHADVGYEPAGAGTLRAMLTPKSAVRTPLFDAIPQRQCTRGEYDGKALSAEDLKLLAHAGAGQGVRVMVMTDRARMNNVLDYVIQGNTAQVNDRAFVDELKTWIRFSEGEAVGKGDGLFARSSGNPTLPRWLGDRLFRWVFTAKAENDKYAKQMRSSAGVAVFVSAKNDKAHWIEAGRCYERFALQATALGIRNAFLNQPVEILPLRAQFASFLGVGPERPDLIVRFGRGPTLPPSLRRPLSAVLV